MSAFEADPGMLLCIKILTLCFLNLDDMRQKSNQSGLRKVSLKSHIIV